ncbi:MAG: hypothetical protein Q4B59_04800 [Lachnospiraceae bacterium]|nr:hypothetical protein [Lachnospiraceae bacterium]
MSKRGHWRRLLALLLAGGMTISPMPVPAEETTQVRTEAPAETEIKPETEKVAEAKEMPATENTSDAGTKARDGEDKNKEAESAAPQESAGESQSEVKEEAVKQPEEESTQTESETSGTEAESSWSESEVPGVETESGHPGEETALAVDTEQTEAATEKAEPKASSAVDSVKQQILKLKGEPLNVTEADRSLIEAVAAAYRQLSAADQKLLDEASCEELLTDGVGTSQSYGRVLEACQWGLYSLQLPDPTTTLPQGVYTTATQPAVSSTSDKGKSTSSRPRSWTVDELIVDAGHNASARISVNSTGYDYIQCGGARYQRLSDSASGVSSFLVPVDPNSTFYIIGHSTSMPTSIAYKMTCAIEEPEQKQSVNVTFSAVNEKKEPIPAVQVLVNSGNTKPTDGIYVLMPGASYTVEIAADGYASERITYTAVQDEVYVFEMKEADCLTLRAEDADSGLPVQASYQVTIKQGTKEETLVPFKAGTYFAKRGSLLQIRGTAAGYDAADRQLTLQGDQELTLQLKKKGSAAADKSAAVNRVIAMIAALPADPREADRAAIIAAQRALIALESDEEARVTNKSRLEAIYKKLGPKKPAGGSGTYRFKNKSTANGSQYQAESLTTTANGQSMFRVVSAILRVDSQGNMKAELTLSGTGYRYLYMGEANAAFEAEEAVGGFKNIGQTRGVIRGEPVTYQDKDGSHSSYRFTIPVQSLDHPILIAAHSWSHDSSSASKSTKQRWKLQGDGTNTYTSIWFQRAIILSSEQLVKVSGDSQAQDNSGVTNRDESKDPDKNESVGPGSGSQTVGKYAFSWSGGSRGHVTIQCQGVEIRGGQAYVTITFVRKASVGGSAKFSQVTSLGQTVSGNNTFTIPVNLNANTAIQAYTTAMSQGHWVNYTIYVGVNDKEILEQVGQDAQEGGALETTLGDQTDRLDEKAPDIVGLRGGREIELKYAKLLKVFEYEDGYRLIEVDLGVKPVKEAALDESIGRAYQSRIVKYLVVSEGRDVPVGLEEQAVLIQQPVSRVYVSSESALKLMDENGDADRIASVGLTEEDELPETIRERMAKDYAGDAPVEFFGSYDNWKLKKMISGRTDLIIESAALIPEEGEGWEEAEKLYRKLTSRACQLETATFFDRSGEEEDERAVEDWRLVYGLLVRPAES